MSDEISIPKDVTEDIRIQFNNRQFDKAKLILAPYVMRFKKLNQKSKTYALTMLTQLKDDEKVLFLAHEELRDEYLEYCDIEILKQQAILAQVKLKNCSEKKSLAISLKILNVVRKRNDLTHADKKFILSIICNVFRILNENKLIQETTQILNPTKPYNHLDFYVKTAEIISRLNSNFFKTGLLGDQSELINLYEDIADKSEILKYTFKLHIISFYWQYNKESNESFEYLKKNRKFAMTTHRSWHDLMLVMFYLNEKQYKKSLILTRQSYKVSNSLPEKIMCLFILNHLGDPNIELSELIFLNCCPIKSVYSYLMGNRYHLDYQDWLFPVMKKFLVLSPKENIQNCWLITRDSITHTSYNKIVINDNSKILDLASGIIRTKDHKTVILTETKIKILSTIISSGHIGIHATSLIDLVYDGEFAFIESAMLRIKNMIVELRKLGFPISRINNHFKYDFTKNSYNIILSVYHKNFSPIIFIEKLFYQERKIFIDRKNLSLTLSIKPSTASKYLKTWKDSGLIYTDISCKNGQYKISENCFR